MGKVKIKKGEEIEILLKAFRNRTKLSIISLLLMNGKMTVTQMSKYINTTRSNLYQTIKEMKNDQLVIISESKIVKNYMEKYYKLNIPIFDNVSQEKLLKEIDKLNADDIREMLISYFVSTSILLNALAEEVRKADNSELNVMKSKFGSTLILSMVTLARGPLNAFSSMYREFVKDLEKKSKENQEKEDNILIVTSFPLNKI
jgi:DNA-binding transcriptional ArsR family regulator